MIDAECALRKVGISLSDLWSQAGSILDTGESFLVGSLAQGFGNRGSDVDIHHFVPDVEKPAPPYLFFVGHVPVDIEHLPEGYANAVVSGLGRDRVRTSAGTFALHTPPVPKQQKLLTRWLTAVPLSAAGEAVYSGTEGELVLAHLMRAALDEVIRSVVLAQLLAAAGHASEFLWMRAQQAILNLVCTARNSPPAGTKWLSSRVETVVSGDEQRRIREVHLGQTERTLEVVGDLVPAIDLGASVRLRKDAELKLQPIGRTRFLLTRYGRLEPEREVLEGPVADVVPGRELEVIDQLRSGLVQLTSDEDAVIAELHRVGC